MDKIFISYKEGDNYANRQINSKQKLVIHNGNSQVDLFNPKDYQYVKELKNNNPNIVRCIPLDDINSFSLTEKPTDDMCKILDENGFVINGTDRYGNDFYIRKELLQ